jgi:hypothetical protein
MLIRIGFLGTEYQSRVSLCAESMKYNIFSQLFSSDSEPSFMKLIESVNISLNIQKI